MCRSERQFSTWMSKQMIVFPPVYAVKPVLAYPFARSISRTINSTHDAERPQSARLVTRFFDRAGQLLGLIHTQPRTYS